MALCRVCFVSLDPPFLPRFWGRCHLPLGAALSCVFRGMPKPSLHTSTHRTGLMSLLAFGTLCMCVIQLWRMSPLPINTQVGLVPFAGLSPNTWLLCCVVFDEPFPQGGGLPLAL